MTKANKNGNRRESTANWKFARILFTRIFSTNFTHMDFRHLCTLTPLHLFGGLKCTKLVHFDSLPKLKNSKYANLCGNIKPLFFLLFAVLFCVNRIYFHFSLTFSQLFWNCRRIFTSQTLFYKNIVTIFGTTI